jgi:hypothetical protein
VTSVAAEQFHREQDRNPLAPAIFEQRQDFLGRPVDGWYWIDDDCSEWMGPFDTLTEAEADHRDLRMRTAP